MIINQYETFKLLSNGVFAINKVKDITSSHVLEQIKAFITNNVKSKYRPQPLKLGHGGTLDHTATGVLVVGIGLGCKILPKLLHGNKSYQVTGQLGVATDTYNETGAIVSESKYDHINETMMNQVLTTFKGKIMQTPPKYSALKLNGERIADLTRAGIDVVMKPRPVMCHSIRCTHFSPPTFKLTISCGGGFYVRSLIHDIGIALDSCAHVTELHRNQHGPFTDRDAINVSEMSLETLLGAIKQTSEIHNSFVTVKSTKKRKDVWDDR